MTLDDSITEALRELGEQLAPTEFREELLTGLHRAYAPGRRMAESFL